MHRAFILSLTIALINVTTLSALANDTDNAGVYANIGITQLSADLDLSQTDISGQSINLGEQSPTITMATGRLGYRLNNYLAFEGELGFGLGGDTLNQAVPIVVGGTTVNVNTTATLDVDSYYAGFARAIYPVSNQFDIFIRAGFGQATANADITASLAGFAAAGSASDKVDGFAYGIGGQFHITAKDGIRADYTQLADANIISLSYARRFR